MPLGRWWDLREDRCHLACATGKLAGEYESRELGPLVVRRKDGQYRGEFESWGSALGVEEQPNGGFLVVLTGPPWVGGVRLQVVDDGQALVLDGGQNMYTFDRR
jgi:hypothetical protein